VRTITVETASRFARDLMVQEVGHAKLRERGIDLMAAEAFIDDNCLREWSENFGDARHVLFLLDACFSGLAATERKGGFDPKNQPFKEMRSRGVGACCCAQPSNDRSRGVATRSSRSGPSREC
jgi:hypothetical protein